MHQVVLTQQILSVIVAVRRTHYDMNVLLVGQLRVGCQVRKVGRPLMIELNQDHRTINAIVKDTLWLGATDPGEPGHYL